MGSQIRGIESLNHCIVPIDLGSNALHIVLEFAGAEPKFARAGIYRELILTLPVLVGYQKSSIADEVVNPHPRMPGVAPGNGHIPTEGDGVFKLGRNTENPNDIPVMHFAGQTLLIKLEFIRPADMVVINSFYDQVVSFRSVRETAGQTYQIPECSMIVHFKDRWSIDAPR